MDWKVFVIVFKTDNSLVVKKTWVLSIEAEAYRKKLFEADETKVVEMELI